MCLQRGNPQEMTMSIPYRRYSQQQEKLSECLSYNKLLVMLTLLAQYEQMISLHAVF